MKHLLTVCLVLASGAFPVAADDDGEITVTGHAEIRVVPDEVILSLGVASFNEELTPAKEDNDRRVSAVLEVARQYGVPDEHLKTDYLHIEPHYDRSYGNENLEGYRVRRSIVITLRDISIFEDLLTASLAAGADHVHGVDFRTTELRQHKDEARSLALVAAQEKAQAMASEYGRTVGDPMKIQEMHSGWWSPYGRWWGSRWSGASQNVIQSVPTGGMGSDGATAPGQLAVSAQVNVTFRLAD
jgi:uncharacterized protein YggE